MSAIRLLLGASALPLISASRFDLPITFRNTYAIVEIEAETPRQTHTLYFDTGSATTWMVDGECAEYCTNYSGWPRKGYNVTQSSTGSSLGTYAEITYIGGVTGGSGVSDVFQLDNTTWEQTFMAANQSSWFWNPADGFMGLAFSSIAEAGAKTMVETMMWAGLLDETRFSIYFGKEFNDTNNAPGEGVLTIGTSEEEKYVDGNMTWVPLQKLDGEYQVWRSTLRTVTANRQGQDSSNNKTVSTPMNLYNSWGVFDTGSGSITVSPDVVDSLYESIGMNYTAILKAEHIPLCTEFNSSWSVSFTFGDDSVNTNTITITGEQLAMPGFANRDDACWPPFEGGDVDGFFLFGTPFLHQFYTIWDFGAVNVTDYKPAVGFGELKAEYKP